jgi:hypothetical protein
MPITIYDKVKIAVGNAWDVLGVLSEGAARAKRAGATTWRGHSLDDLSPDYEEEITFDQLLSILIKEAAERGVSNDKIARWLVDELCGVLKCNADPDVYDFNEIRDAIEELFERLEMTD